MTVEVVTIGDANEIEEKIKAFARNHSNGGLFVAPDPFTTTHRAKIVAIVARYNVRTIYPYRWFAVAGGLISYGPDVLDQFRRAGGYVDRILKGEIPRGLPVQAPSKFELVLNLKSAKALGVSFGPLLLASADEVIE
jgi:putative ABC transport system substrate-binding protein